MVLDVAPDYIGSLKSVPQLSAVMHVAPDRQLNNYVEVLRGQNPLEQLGRRC
jgi:hypothetical protein